MFLVAFYLAKYVAIGIALVPVYAIFFNGVTHVITSIALRRYNPGLYTALALFLPLGIYLLMYFNTITRSNLLFIEVNFWSASSCTPSSWLRV